jgi:hypothetical protein
MRSLLVLAAALLSVLPACSGPSHQRVAMPAASSPVAPNATRVYVGRRDQSAGSWRNVRVWDNDREIGVLHEGEYLCWDRPAGQGVARFVFEGLGFDQDAVESMCEIPDEGGATVYLGITIEREGRKPLITRLEESEGRAKLASRKPAEVNP